MRRELAAVYDELLRRQKAGERSVYFSEEALSVLREAARTRPPVEAEAPESRAVPVAGAGQPVPRPAQEGPLVPPPPVLQVSEGTKEERWASLRASALSDGWAQSQVKAGKQVVFGTGSLEAAIFFCGEAPGAEEEEQGVPFIGPAGQLLTRIIQAMGLRREDVYIANIMTYRPPMPGPVGNRAPTREEMAYCLPWLLGQLAVVRPRLIVGLGKTALDGLLGPDPKRRMTRMRGHWTEFEGIPLMPTFHPSYLLRNQSLSTKRQVWEDMLAVMEKLALPISDRQRGYFLGK